MFKDWQDLPKKGKLCHKGSGDEDIKGKDTRQKPKK